MKIEENKGKYKVEFVAADTEAHSKNMKLAAQDGSLPEIVHLDSAEAPEYNEAGYLLDMSDFLKENKDIDDALDGMEDAFNDGKVQYGLPYQSNVQGFFYNKDLFDKAGIAYPTDDTTYDEFLDMIAKLKNSGVTPIAIGSKNSGYSMWEFNEFFSRYGWEDNEKSYTGDKAKYSNEHFRKIWQQSNILTQNSSLMKEKQQCSEQVSGTVQNLIKMSVNTSDSGGDQNLGILLMNRILQ